MVDTFSSAFIPLENYSPRITVGSMLNRSEAAEYCVMSARDLFLKNLIWHGLSNAAGTVIKVHF